MLVKVTIALEVELPEGVDIPSLSLDEKYIKFEARKAGSLFNVWHPTEHKLISCKTKVEECK